MEDKKRERYLFENLTLWGLEEGINKYEKEIAEGLARGEVFDVDKNIILEKLKKEVERRNCIIYESKPIFYVSEKLREE